MLYPILNYNIYFKFMFIDILEVLLEGLGGSSGNQHLYQTSKSEARPGIHKPSDSKQWLVLKLVFLSEATIQASYIYILISESVLLEYTTDICVIIGITEQNTNIL